LPSSGPLTTPFNEPFFSTGILPGFVPAAALVFSGCTYPSFSSAVGTPLLEFTYSDPLSNISPIIKPHKNHEN
jgi:hypothetical protein